MALPDAHYVQVASVLFSGVLASTERHEITFGGYHDHADHV